VHKLHTMWDIVLRCIFTETREERRNHFHFPQIPHAIYAMHGQVFKGLKVSLDISNFVEKQKIQKLVKENGGDVSVILNKKVFNSLLHHILVIT
jgi:hypothetical protein